MIISQLSTKKVTVFPQSDRVKILGVHFKPYAIANFTSQAVNELPFIIELRDLFRNQMKIFEGIVKGKIEIIDKFKLLESLILQNLKSIDLSVIKKAVTEIESCLGNIQVCRLAEVLNMNERTLRNHFQKYVGCSPKDYITLVRLKQTIYDLKFSNKSLTEISYKDVFFDQSHLIKIIKSFAGKSPKVLHKEIPTFRFLQF